MVPWGTGGVGGWGGGERSGGSGVVGRDWCGRWRRRVLRKAVLLYSAGRSRGVQNAVVAHANGCPPCGIGAAVGALALQGQGCLSAAAAACVKPISIEGLSLRRLAGHKRSIVDRWCDEINYYNIAALLNDHIESSRKVYSKLRRKSWSQHRRPQSFFQFAYTCVAFAPLSASAPTQYETPRRFVSQPGHSVRQLRRGQHLSVLHYWRASAFENGRQGSWQFGAFGL